MSSWTSAFRTRKVLKRGAYERKEGLFEGGGGMRGVDVFHLGQMNTVLSDLSKDFRDTLGAARSELSKCEINENCNRF